MPYGGDFRPDACAKIAKTKSLDKSLRKLQEDATEWARLSSIPLESRTPDETLRFKEINRSIRRVGWRKIPGFELYLNKINAYEELKRELRAEVNRSAKAVEEAQAFLQKLINRKNPYAMFSIEEVNELLGESVFTYKMFKNGVIPCSYIVPTKKRVSYYFDELQVQLMLEAFRACRNNFECVVTYLNKSWVWREYDRESGRYKVKRISDC